MKLLFVSAAATLLFTSWAPAQTASAVRYGKACVGNTDNCLDKNWGSANSRALPSPTADRWVLVRVTVPTGQTLDVTGFIFRLEATVPNLRIETGVFRADQSTTRPIFSSRVAGTEVYLTSRVSLFAPTWFPRQRFTANEIFYIGFRTEGQVTPFMPDSGVAAQWYTATTGGSLTQQSNWPWMYRILCNGASPDITAVSLPRIGTMFNVSLDDAPTAAVMMMGTSRDNFGPIPLPYDLSGYNHQQCDLSVSLNYQFAGTRTSASTWLWSQPIPNDTGMLGVKLYLQWACLVNASRLRTSQALDVTIGT